MNTIPNLNRLAAGIGSLTLLFTLAGCGLGNIATNTTPQDGVTLSGKVHGGEQGIIGSTVQLYAVGTTGYGSNATPLIASTVTTDQSGGWSITGKYTCPSAATQVYLTATGGNPGMAAGTNNTAIKLVAALGRCDSLSASTSIDINEVSTVAAAFALGQYFGTNFAVGLNAPNTLGDSFGSPSTTQALLGITNAMATTFRLSDYTSGNAVVSQTVTGAAGSLTTTPESAKLYTIANILASCVNTAGPSSSPCQTLFTNVAPSGFTVPVDVLQAAVYMSLNPTSTTAGFGANNNSQTNLANLFALQTPVAPFVGVTSQPYDWTLGVLYSAGSSTTQTLINGANGVAIDASGNIFVINYTSSTGAATGTTIFGPTGAPLYTAQTFGGVNTTTPNVLALRNIAVDLNGNGYATSSSTGGGLLGINSGTGATSYFSLGGQAYGIAVDGSNNIFVTHNSASSNTSSFDEFLGGTVSAATQYKYPFDSATTLNQAASITTGGTLVESRGSTSSPTVLEASGITPGSCTTGPCTPANDTGLAVTYATATLPSSSLVYQTAAEKNGGFWAPNATANSTNVVYITGTTVTSYGSATSFFTPRSVAVDGANNAWITDRGGSALSEITTAGVILSPVTTNNGTATVGTVGFSHSALSSQAGIAIDPSGNIWVPSANQAAGAAQQNSMYEMIGAAAPTVTPIALALKNNAVGSRP